MFEKGLVFLDLNIASKPEVLAFLAGRLSESGKIATLGEFLRDAESREAVCSTYIGQGVAVPHGVSGTRELAAAFARLARPVDWGDGEPVSYVFLIAAPRGEKGNGYIEAIGRLSRFLLEENSIAAIAQAQTEQQALELLSGI